jgi:pseudouridine-5'-phosphate glycosidase/pseudouridine kinase
MHLFRSLKSPKPLFRGLSAWSHLRTVHAKDAPLDIHPEVEDALSNHKPVVALETALVTHGLPYPSSLEVPLSLEGIVRSTGAIPATIGIINGRVKVGLERYELERLAERKNKPSKISRRDIAAAIATEADGGTFCYSGVNYLIQKISGTTCSATLIFSALAGIKVYSTIFSSN